MAKTLILIAEHTAGNIFINRALKPFKTDPEKYQVSKYTDASNQRDDAAAMFKGFTEFAVQQIKLHKPLHLIVMADVNLGLSGQDVNSLKPLIDEVIRPALARSAFESGSIIKPSIKIYGVIGGGRPATHSGAISFTHNEKKHEITPTPFKVKEFQSGHAIDGIVFVNKAIRSPSAPPRSMKKEHAPSGLHSETKKDMDSIAEESQLPKMTANPPKEVKKILPSNRRSVSANSGISKKKDSDEKRAKSDKLSSRSLFRKPTENASNEEASEENLVERKKQSGKSNAYTKS